MCNPSSHLHDKLLVISHCKNKQFFIKIEIFYKNTYNIWYFFIKASKVGQEWALSRDLIHYERGVGRESQKLFDSTRHIASSALDGKSQEGSMCGCWGTLSRLGHFSRMWPAITRVSHHHTKKKLSSIYCTYLKQAQIQIPYQKK